MSACGPTEPGGGVRVSPDEKRLRQELVKARASLDRSPGSGRRLEPVARLLHWLGDPEAAGYFRRAAENRVEHVRRTERKRLVQDPENLLAIGNFYRLARDPEESERYLE